MTTETMREAVARDMYQAHLNLYRKIAAPWDMLDKFERERWLRYADAAIRTVLERLREPSEAVWTAGREPILARDSRMPASMLVEQSWYDAERDPEPRKDGYITKGDCAVWVWRAMLDAAVREVG